MILRTHVHCLSWYLGAEPLQFLGWKTMKVPIWRYMVKMLKKTIVMTCLTIT